jgi:release factor glutamine methyltransferase
VFVPRPETEVVAEAAIVELRRLLARHEDTAHAEPPVLLDLCAGSAAIALAAATEVPGTRVIAVEVSEPARAWAAANIERLAPGRVDLRAGDVADPGLAAGAGALADLAGVVDVLVSNPPYVPPGQEPVDPEVRDHDPRVALYGGGPDGLDVPRAVIALAAHLVRPGGLFVMEHADVQGSAALAALDPRIWSAAEDHRDLLERPRFVTARRVASPPC